MQLKKNIKPGRVKVYLIIFILSQFLTINLYSEIKNKSGSFFKVFTPYWRHCNEITRNRKPNKKIQNIKFYNLNLKNSKNIKDLKLTNKKLKCISSVSNFL